MYKKKTLQNVKMIINYSNFIWLLTTENIMKTLNHLGGLYYKRI